MVAQTKAIDDAHAALVKASTDAKAPSYAVDVQTTKIGVDDKADLFHFVDGKVTTDDFAIGATGGGFAKGDALYIGEGFTLNTTAKYDATGAGSLTGGNNGVKEVFFIKDNGVVKAVIETADLGSSTFNTLSLAGSINDQVSVIPLTGVSDVSQVSFANGVISHVA